MIEIMIEITTGTTIAIFAIACPKAPTGRHAGTFASRAIGFMPDAEGETTATGEAHHLNISTAVAVRSRT
jgi:hypothetical protein